MTRPVFDPPEWASDETNNTEPSATQKETGWTVGQDGVSDYDNWYKQRAWSWLKYLQNEEQTLVMFPGVDGHVRSGATGTTRQDGSVETTGWSIPLKLMPGRVIREIRNWYYGGPLLGAGTTWTISLQRETFNVGLNEFVFDSQVVLTTFTLSARDKHVAAAIDYTIEPYEPQATAVRHFLVVTASGTAGDSMRWERVEIDYDRDVP